MMKTVFTIALVLIAAGILMVSCSQPLSTSRVQSQNAPVTTDVGSTNYQNESDYEGNQPTAIVGISPEIVENVEAKDTPNTIAESYENALTLEGTTKGEVVQKRNTSMHNSFSSDYDISSQESKIESFDNPNNGQIVNYSGNSGHSGGGRLPFWFLVVLAIFIPPLAVAIMYGITDKFWICLGLTCIFFIPGMIYALIQIFH
jgi:uncharacterized membrane protein YqaE (UPF0057 family)